MKYNLTKAIDKQRFTQRSSELCEKGEFVELRKISPVRTSSQNRYLHLLFGWFAISYGERMDYVKQVIFKRWVNEEIFLTEHVNKITGEIRKDWRSTADLDSKEMTLAIERFRDYAVKESIPSVYLPAPNETEYLKEIEIEMERHKQYI